MRRRHAERDRQTELCLGTRERARAKLFGKKKTP